MKNLLTGIAVIALTQGCSWTYTAMASGEGVSLILEQRSTDISIELHNASNSPVDVALPMVITIDGSVAGVELIFIDGYGKRHNLCSSIQISSPPVNRVLRSGDKAGLTEDLQTLTTMYCLSPGRYKLTTVFHNVLRGRTREKPKTVRSNTVEFMAR